MSEVTIQNLGDLFPENELVDITNSLSSTTFPYMGRMRSLDINIDGYPDLFITLTFYNKAIDSHYT